MRTPEHLRPETAAWWAEVAGEYELGPHARLLTAAAESWDRLQEAREALDQHGTTFEDRFGSPRARPEVAIERDSRIAFIRALAALDLRDEQPGEGRR